MQSATMDDYTFSKPLSALANVKKDFLDRNDELLSNAAKINTLYSNQPKRIACKTCESPLSQVVDFSNHGLQYQICTTCGHLNGLYEDTPLFASSLYKDNGGGNYAGAYLEDYKERLATIYTPKVDFLVNAMRSVAVESNWCVEDFGCGAGHFVNALSRKQIKSRGFDISNQLIRLAEAAWVNDPKLAKISTPPFDVVEGEASLLCKLEESSAAVISLVGVLEHLTNPLAALSAFRYNKSRFLFISLPLFSLSVFIEQAFPDVFPRHLSGGHTHLYTHASIGYICKKYGLKQRAMWHFGCDAMDLRRSLLVQCKKEGMSEKAQYLFEETFFNPALMDALQEAIDRSFSASEIHMLLEKQ
jgi:SAM-dependent methyltransferase